MPRLSPATALLAAVSVLAWISLAAAQPAEHRSSPGPAQSQTPAATTETPLPADVVTTHSIKLGGAELAYTATAGALQLTNGKGEHTAEIFYVAYTRNGAAPSSRPITFAFNGGPGAGSAYLHVGAIGPRILDYGSGREPPFTSGRIIDNPDTWLDFTDLVFIDPVGTGYSRSKLSPEETRKQFWGVKQDLESLGQIVRLALAHLDRFASPVYVAGESYGGFRAARLPRQLGAQQGIVVHGATLISPVLDMSLIGRDELNPMPWALRLPSYAAVALEAKGKLSADNLRDAEHFALGDYITTLVSLPADSAAADRFYGTVAGMIGLPEPLVARWRGKVPLGVFVKEIRHGDDEVVSRYDGSVATADPYPSWYVGGDEDPILAGINAPLTTGFVAYVRDELKYKTDRNYLLLNFEVGRHWDWHSGSGEDDHASAGDDLREGLALDPRLRILIAHGMTDLQTPYMTSRYLIDQLPPAVTRDHVTLKLYPGGHMMYLRPASRAALHADARAIYGME
ncbi:MAG TPA: hypothetical protein VMC10_14565 [Stellaceae bacterium]|nr:hypothetical protein [Stellaceae bacterium]